MNDDCSIQMSTQEDEEYLLAMKEIDALAEKRLYLEAEKRKADLEIARRRSWLFLASRHLDATGVPLLVPL